MASRSMKELLAGCGLVTLFLTTGCGDTAFEPDIPPVPTLDIEIRRQLTMWGVVRSSRWRARTHRWCSSGRR